MTVLGVIITGLAVLLGYAVVVVCVYGSVKELPEDEA